MSQVVIVCKKTGKICLCIDFRKLNAISIHDSFPLPHVEEALQAVQAAVWFSSFDLAQGYLQMAMQEEDIPKTTFRAGSSGLYEFTRMPYDFDIIYHTGKSNLVADALSRCPEVNEEVEREGSMESDEDEWIAVSYQVEDQGGCISLAECNQAISELVGGTKIEKKLKDRIHIMDMVKEKMDGNTIKVATGMVGLFNSITSKGMAEYQDKTIKLLPY